MQPEPINRRRFLQGSAAATVGLTAGATLTRTARGQSANDRVIIGCMGIGGRGSYLTQKFAQRAAKVRDCEVAYVCDIDDGRLKRGVGLVEQAQGKAPKAVADFRKMLDDKDVDALVIATPDHWHALPVVWGAQAGKHSYVEKPASHSIWEGRKMVEASRKHKKVVQLGTQSRSCEYMRKCIEYIKSGKLGKVHMIKVYNMIQKRSSFKAHGDCDPPKGFDWEKWLGPAPMRPFNPDRLRWNWWWDYSGGDIINDGVHQMDLANWVLDSRSPTGVYCYGGKFAVDDPLDAPDTQTVVYEFPDLTMTFELAMWTPYIHKTDMRVRDGDYFPDWPFNSTRIEIYGTKEIMMLGRHGGGWQAFKPGTISATVITRDKSGKETKAVHKIPGSIEAAHAHGIQGNTWHQDDFIKCIRNGERPNGDIENGHKSTTLCNLGNISLRVGCKKLLWDGEKEQFTNCDEANKLVRRTYRDPWVIKDEV
ncbi:MAG: Gfo/Idh/MocA family oxidoreductase [Phycisphaerae bacterium]|nr:Gfo/Idh/MocA family oxidoreductase [Phycisphaerae bacterium]